MDVYVTDLGAWCGINFEDVTASPLSAQDSMTFTKETSLYLNDVLVTDAEIPEGVTSVSARAFYNYKKLETISLPASLTFVGESAFKKCDNLTEVHISDVAAWCGVTFEKDSSIYSPDNANPLSIAHKLYLNGTPVTHLEIPEGVTSIGQYAFYGCTGITSAAIPASLTSVGKSAFENCFALTDIYITDLAAWCGINFEDVTANPLGSNLYLNETLVTQLEIPEGVASIGQDAFSYCTCFTAITFPNSVSTIGAQAFAGCTGLTEITIPDSVSTIGKQAFMSCSNLAAVTLPSGLTALPEWLFDSCGALTQVNIPESVTVIGSCAFSGCAKLASVNIPEGVTEIGSSAFHGCAKLTSVNIPEGVTEIGLLAFYGCAKLTSVNIPKSVTEIGERAFYNSGLTSISLPAGMTSVPAYLCYGCTKLTSVKLPEGLTTIENSAFYGCTALSRVVMPSSVTEVNSYAFRNCSKYILKIYGEPGSYAQTVATRDGYTFRSLTPTFDVPNVDLEGAVFFVAAYNGNRMLDIVEVTPQEGKLVANFSKDVLYTLTATKLFVITQDTWVPKCAGISY